MSHATALATSTTQPVIVVCTGASTATMTVQLLPLQWGYLELGSVLLPPPPLIMIDIMEGIDCFALI